MEIEWLILADAAEIVNGKLYMMGGGWNRITANSGLPLTKSFGIAISVTVPWSHTNERHQMEIEFQDADGNVLGKIGGAFEVGRAPGILKGTTQRAQLALSITIGGLKAGPYRAAGRLLGYPDSERLFPFVVVPGQNIGNIERTG